MIEQLILAHLVKDEEYARKVIPFLTDEYFSSETHKVIFRIVKDFVQKYKTTPTFDAIKLSLDQENISESTFKDAQKTIEDLIATARIDSSRKEWLLDETEKFCQQKALYNAISSSIHMIDKDFKTASAVPEMLKDALAVSFDTHIGHDYLEDSSERFDLIHQNVKRIPFDIDLLNTITKGGLAPKTLNIVVGGVGVGKSLVLCHIASSTIAQGKNVLYITLEMAEERIAQRIDANLLNVSMDAIDDMNKAMYETAFRQLRKQNNFGRLIIKEYPTSTGNVMHFRSLIDDLAIKRGFVPDLLIVDYINICASARLKNTGQVNSYSYVKAIAEELRGLAVELNLPCLSATQFNREGFDSSDPGMTNTSESWGLPQTTDLQLAIVTSDELEREGLLLVKQLKNRYSDIAKNKRFTVCVEKSKMRISNDPVQAFSAAPIPAAVQSNIKPFTPGSKFKSATVTGITF